MSVGMDRSCPSVDHYIRGADHVYCPRCGGTWKHDTPPPQDDRPRSFYDARVALARAGREDEIA